MRDLKPGGIGVACELEQVVEPRDGQVALVDLSARGGDRAECLHVTRPQRRAQPRPERRELVELGRVVARRRERERVDAGAARNALERQDAHRGHGMPEVLDERPLALREQHRAVPERAIARALGGDAQLRDLLKGHGASARPEHRLDRRRHVGGRRSVAPARRDVARHDDAARVGVDADRFERQRDRATDLRLARRRDVELTTAAVSQLDRDLAPERPTRQRDERALDRGAPAEGPLEDLTVMAGGTRGGAARVTFHGRAPTSHHRVRRRCEPPLHA
jgi:hypothetical protein